jgi:hypothetical protein
MLHGMVIIKIQANKEQRLLENYLVKSEGKEGKKYEDDARLMDIYSFSGYQVEIEVPTNPDGSSKPVILDETHWDEVDPVVLGEAGISIYEILAVWVMFLYILLAMLINPAMALSDHNRQVIAYDCRNPSGIQAYDTCERNHWCDLNPQIDSTNTDITLTNVLYVLLQKVPRVRIKIRTCKVTKTVVPLY